MRSFRDIVALALRFRWMLAGILLSSIMAAALWGANLGSIYPIVDVVLQRQSMRDWIQARINDSRAESERLRQIIETARNEHEETAEATAAQPLEQAIWQDRLRAEEQRLKWSLWFQPWIDRFTPDTPFATLQWIALVLLAGTVVKSIFLVMNSILVEQVTQRVALELRSQLFQVVMRADMRFFGRQRQSQLLSHFTHDVECVVGGIRTVFGRSILEPLKIIACLTGAAIVCWRLLVFSLIVTPIAILIINRLAHLVKRANHRAMQEMAGIYDRLSESIQGIQLVKACHREEYEQARFRRRGTEYLRRMGRIATLTAMTKPGNELMGISVLCLALLAGGYLVLNRETRLLGITMSDRPLDFPLLMTFFALLAGVSDPFRKLVDVYGQIQQAAAAAERLQELTAMQTELSVVARPIPMTSPLRQIQLIDVSFGYSDHRNALQDINLTISAGETIALVGPNGCGKSTLLSLLLRLYDPLAGRIEWNGVDLRDTAIQDLRQRIGMVTQQAFLFDESVLENIRYGRPGASREQVMEAARQASADGFIQTDLPHGFDTVVGTGGKHLSGGQRQRIALARTILRDPELLLLDEATSQIDVESQTLIHDALMEFCQDRTTILITHRPEILSLADRIVVMADGRIVDVGTEGELLGRCRFYQQLWRPEHDAPALRASA